MKTIKFEILIIPVLVCCYSFVKVSNQKGFATFDKYKEYSDEQVTVNKNNSLAQNTQPSINDTNDLKNEFLKIIEDAKSDFSAQIAEKINETKFRQDFKYKITLSGVGEIVLKTINENKTINTIYFKSIFYMETEEEKTRETKIKKIFLQIANDYTKNKNFIISKEIDAMKNKVTYLRDALGNRVVQLVEKSTQYNKAETTLFIYGKSANKK